MPGRHVMSLLASGVGSRDRTRNFLLLACILPYLMRTWTANVDYIPKKVVACALYGLRRAGELHPSIYTYALSLPVGNDLSSTAVATCHICLLQQPGYKLPVLSILLDPSSRNLVERKTYYSSPGWLLCYNVGAPHPGFPSRLTTFLFTESILPSQGHWRI